MKLTEKIGLGLHPLEKYGFDKIKKARKVYFEQIFDVEGSNGSENVKKVKISFCVKEESIQTEIISEDETGKQLSSYKREYASNRSIETILTIISSDLKGKYLEIQ